MKDHLCLIGDVSQVHARRWASEMLARGWRGGTAARVLVVPSSGTWLGKGCVASVYSLMKGEFPDFAILTGQPAWVVKDIRRKGAELLRRCSELSVHGQAWAGGLTT